LHIHDDTKVEPNEGDAMTYDMDLRRLGHVVNIVTGAYDVGLTNKMNGRTLDMMVNSCNLVKAMVDGRQNLSDLLRIVDVDSSLSNRMDEEEVGAADDIHNVGMDKGWKLQKLLLDVILDVGVLVYLEFYSMFQQKHVYLTQILEVMRLELASLDQAYLHYLNNHSDLLAALQTMALDKNLIQH
jgi:hypothetical protein